MLFQTSDKPQRGRGAEERNVSYSSAPPLLGSSAPCLSLRSVKEAFMKRLAAPALLVVLIMTGGSVSARAETKEVQMTAKKYEFSPSSVEVPVGATVVFKITALDRDHGFEIEGVKDSCVELKKGEIATVEYKAEKAGTYSFKCCKRCGLHHGQMRGTIVVK
ncbi:MAG: hypothetical protein DMG08_16480 [Acidobacteria bacterium]|nr:MAG: hypothetical protein DMG08_16480 [Acidobacteriota bacterium]PYU99331.1 MAG: hypothetical protein DMG10_25480 [Acidobacteriota bacterium]PYV38292.1 MAG: hypothetical protein DMG09_12370 [Acidobacteriota bacterium]